MSKFWPFLAEISGLAGAIKERVIRQSFSGSLGCIVNGPGEAKEVDLGLTGGTPNNLIYIDGKPSQKLSQENLVDELEQLIRAKAREKAAQQENLIAKS